MWHLTYFLINNVFNTSTSTIVKWRKNMRILKVSNNSVLSNAGLKHKSKVSLDENYDKATEDNDWKFSFAKSFTCLRSAINFILDSTRDVKSRVHKGSKATRSLLFVKKRAKCHCTQNLICVVPWCQGSCYREARNGVIEKKKKSNASQLGDHLAH